MEMFQTSACPSVKLEVYCLTRCYVWLVSLVTDVKPRSTPSTTQNFSSSLAFRLGPNHGTISYSPVRIDTGHMEKKVLCTSENSTVSALSCHRHSPHGSFSETLCRYKYFRSSPQTLIPLFVVSQDNLPREVILFFPVSRKFVVIYIRFLMLQINML